MKIYTTIILLVAITLSSYSQDYPDGFYNGEKYILKSNILTKESDIFVYLPNDYYTDTLRTYPVHYVTDAPSVSNLYFDLLQFQFYSGQAPQSIVVGLSGDDRNQNLLPGPGAGKYLEYLEKEVIPFIDDTYRTASFRLLGGHSLGGDFVIFALLTNPSLFSGYIAGSPGPLELVIDILKESEKTPDLNENYKYFFSSIGSRDATDAVQFQEFKEQYEQIFSGKTDAHFVINENEDHISNIATNFQHGIAELYDDWMFELPEESAVTRPADELVNDHIHNLQQKFGKDVHIGESDVFFPAMEQFAMNKDFESAIKVLNSCIDLHPNSDQAFAFLGQAYIEIGQKEKAKYFLEKSLKINPRNKMARSLKSMLLSQ